MDNPDMKKPHSHQPDENAITIAKCRDTMKRKAKLTLDKPNQIFSMQMSSFQMTPKHIYHVPIPASVS
jgi:hypothetical protein